MKLLFEELCAPQRAGGIEAACAGLATQLARLGHELIRHDATQPLPQGWQPDVVHVHGIWSPALMARWRHWRSAGVPCLVTVHGMLEPWALAHKKWKKRLAWLAYQKRMLQSATCLHATSDREARNLRALGLKPPIAMIPWGIGVGGEDRGRRSEVGGQEEEDRGQRSEGRSQEEDCSGASMTVADFGASIQNPRSTIPNPTRTALFVGRIYPVKGLPMLVEAWARVRPEGWRMMIVGPDEAGHLAEVKQLCGQLGLEWKEGRAGSTYPVDLSPSACVAEEPACGGPALQDEVSRMRKSDPTVVFAGPLSGAALEQAYENADLYIQPSHTENFGMAIAEAMSHRLPVITTHGAPWKLLEEERCGWWVPVSVDGIAAALDDATRRSPEELAAMGERGRAVVAERFSWDKIAAEMIVCYEWILGGGEVPGCVRQCWMSEVGCRR